MPQRCLAFSSEDIITPTRRRLCLLTASCFSLTKIPIEKIKYTIYTKQTSHACAK